MRKKLFALEEMPINEKASPMTSATKKETEVTMYALIGDMEGLQKALKKEVHHQLDSEFKNGTRCRVRSTQSGDSDKLAYEFTFKTSAGEAIEGLEANIEHNVPIDSQFFTSFRNIATDEMFKTRYIFESAQVSTTIVKDGQDQNIVLPKVLYEVDVFKDHTGQDYPWCKIDIEIDNILNHLNSNQLHQEFKLNIKISHLPFKPSKVIIAQSLKDNQEEFVNKLWRDVYKHPILKA